MVLTLSSAAAPDADLVELFEALFSPTSPTEDAPRRRDAQAAAAAMLLLQPVAPQQDERFCALDWLAISPYFSFTSSLIRE